MAAETAAGMAGQVTSETSLNTTTADGASAPAVTPASAEVEEAAAAAAAAVPAASAGPLEDAETAARADAHASAQTLTTADNEGSVESATANTMQEGSSSSISFPNNGVPALISVETTPTSSEQLPVSSSPSVAEPVAPDDAVARADAPAPDRATTASAPAPAPPAVAPDEAADQAPPASTPKDALSAAAAAGGGAGGKGKMARWRGKKEIVVGRQAVRRPRVGGGHSGTWDVTQGAPGKDPHHQQQPTMQFTYRFNVGKKLGEGGYGLVETCNDTTGELGAGPLAVKTISKEALYADCQRLEDFEARRIALAREVDVMNRVRGHEHVVQVKKVYNNSERLRVVMEMCEAGNLLEHLAARIELLRQERGSFGSSGGFFGSSGGGGGGIGGFVFGSGGGSSGSGGAGGRSARGGRGPWAGGLPENEAAVLFKQLVEGVAFCHRRRVLHRDVKLENALLALPTGRQSEAENLEAELRMVSADMAHAGDDAAAGGVGGAGGNGRGQGDEGVQSAGSTTPTGASPHQRHHHHHHHFNLFSILPQGARSPALKSPAADKSPRLNSPDNVPPPAAAAAGAFARSASAPGPPPKSPINTRPPRSPHLAAPIPPSPSESSALSPAAIAAAVSAGSSAVSLGLVVKLADFGFAMVLRDGETASGTCGTPGYMAPELVSEEKYSFPVDIWSLGVVLHALLFGELPHYREPRDVVTEGVPRPGARKWKVISEAARELHQAILQLDPSKRPTAALILKHPWFEQAEAALMAGEAAEAGGGAAGDRDGAIGAKSGRMKSGRAASGRAKSGRNMEFLGHKGGGGKEGAGGGGAGGGGAEGDDKGSVSSPPSSPRVVVLRLKLGARNLALRFKYGFIPTAGPHRKHAQTEEEEEGKGGKEEKGIVG